MVINTNRRYRKKYNKKQAPILGAVSPTKGDIALEEKSPEKAMLGPVETKSCKNQHYHILHFML